MKADIAKWSRRYKSALRLYLKPGKLALVRPASDLGHQAVGLGMETLDVATVHRAAFASLASPDGVGIAVYRGKVKLAKEFFAETIVPIESVHSAALEKNAHIHNLKRTLNRRTKESTSSASRLAKAKDKRKAAEAVLKNINEQHAALLSEAQTVQRDLQHQARCLLSAQESGRSRDSLELRDEIAQILLAIDISLLALKTSENINEEKTHKELAKARRLVGKSRKRMRSQGA